jgi:hypothetical protein
LQATYLVILIIILSAWVGRPAAAWPPTGSLTTQAGGSALGASQSADEELALEPGKPVERELSGGQSHVYKIAMTSGQYLQVSVSQRGMEVLAALFTPDSRKIGEVDSEHSAVGAEAMSVIAEAAGVYRIEVRSAEKTAKTGR